jgi:hypothetical protein
LSEVRCVFWASLFVHREAVYLMGTTKENGSIVICRSADEGKSWSHAAGPDTGLLTSTGHWHTAPVPVVEWDERLWRSFEMAEEGRRWGDRFHAGVLSARADADLLNTTNWIFSNFLPQNPQWLGGDFGGWLEGNVVITPEEKLINMLRVDTSKLPEKAALMGVSADGRNVSFNPDGGFIDMPGGAKKFTIHRDPLDGAYWTLATIAAGTGPEGRAHSALRPAEIRNTLALMRSRDLQTWDMRATLLHHPEVAHHGFQYVDWQIDGEDLVAVCRTAFDDATGGAHNYHDANFLTFHRIKNFRQAKSGMDR